MILRIVGDEIVHAGSKRRTPAIGSQISHCLLLNRRKAIFAHTGVLLSMSRDDRPEARIDEATRKRLKRVLGEHPVSFAMLFGSAGCGTMSDTSDLDLAVEFTSLRPSDNGYSQAYLQLISAIDDAVSRSVDVVDIYSMPPTFARAAFDNGEILVGSDAQRERLERELVGEASTVADAYERVAAAVDRLREGQ